jgi:hypothetical protein
MCLKGQLAAARVPCWTARMNLTAITVSPAMRRLGFAGLLPAAACLALMLTGGEHWRWTALAIGYLYAVLIFSFLGGVWWGLAVLFPDAPRWTPLAAVMPSLIGLASFAPWLFGYPWPRPSLILVGLLLLVSPLIDRAIVGAAPGGDAWIILRVQLSTGLGVLSLLIALL